MKSRSPKIKQFLLHLLKLIIVGLAFYFISGQMAKKELNWNLFADLFNTPESVMLFAILLILTFLNRFLEILKWKNLAQILKPLSIWESTKQVLIGITFGIVTPNGIGEYAGKAWFYPRSQAGKVVFLNAVCNGIQVVFAVLFGLLGTLYVNMLHRFIPTYYLGLFLGICAMAALFIFYIKDFQIKGFSLQGLFSSLREIPRKIHQRNILLALLRYGVLLHQYFILYTLFQVNIPYMVLMAVVACIYLLASSLPNFQALDFALKGGIAVYLLGFFGVEGWVVPIVAASIWLLNLVIPVAIGSIFLLFFNPKKRQSLHSDETVS